MTNKAIGLNVQEKEVNKGVREVSWTKLGSETPYFKSRDMPLLCSLLNER